MLETSLVVWLKAYWLPIAISLIVLRLITNKFRKVLHSIPGPSLAAYTSLWRCYNVASGDAHQTAISLHQRHGPLVRVGPNHVSVGDGAEIPKIYGFKSGYKKTGFYPIQSGTWKKRVVTNMFSTTDESRHASLRRPVAHLFSLSDLLEKEPAVDECTSYLISRFSDCALADKSVNLDEWMSFWAFDVIGEITFAKKFGFIDAARDLDGILATNRIVVTYMATIGQIPALHPFLLGNPCLPYIFPQIEGGNAALVFTLKAMAAQGAQLQRDGDLTDDDLQALDAKGDFLSRLTAMALASPPKLSTEDVIIHLTTNVFAGTHTTVAALSSAFYHLATHPSCMARLVTEMDTADDRGLLSSPIQFREAQAHLPYLTAVLKEAMRLHPSLGLMLERTVPAAGASICGQHIPAGTIVGVNAWVVARDASVYPEPDKFVPERWLDSSVEQLKRMERNWFVFGAGSRGCVGQNMSWLLLCKVVPEVVRRFEMRSEGKWRVRCRWMMFREGVVMKLRERAGQA